MQSAEATVAAGAWLEQCVALAGDGHTMLDFLTAIDDPGAGRIEVLAHLVDVAGRRRVLVRTNIPREAPVLDSLVVELPGAAWHEREVHEMFGVRFAGNPDLRPLLTTGDMGLPLRRTTPLPARLQTPWPGAVDPADRPAATVPGSPGLRVAARPRSRLAAPGIPSEWHQPGVGEATP
jgi:NADH:ubiquinone oxidoreductase subunit C